MSRAGALGVRAKAAYDDILRKLNLLPTEDRFQAHPSRVEITAASDSFLVVGDRLQEVANWCSAIVVGALRAHLLVRGSIAYGRHVQQNIHAKGKSRHHLLAVSEALVLAAMDEKRKSPPCCVTLDSSVSKKAIRELDGTPRLAKQRAILFREERWITNPFGSDVLLWAKKKLQEMLDANKGTSHQDKYEWILMLFEDVAANKPMRPTEY